MKLVIEVLDNLRKCKERKIYSSFPVTLGRSYNSDLILSDSSVCPSHVEIDFDSENNIIVKDLNSVNGLYSYKKKRNVKEIQITKSSDFRIGNTSLRVFNSNIEVAKTKQLNKPNFWSKRFKFGIPHALLGLVCFLLFYFLDNYIFNYRTGSNQKFETLISALIGGLGVFIPWAAVWSLVGKVNINKPRFFSHLSIPIYASLFYFLFKKTFSYLSYGLAQPSFLNYLIAIISFLALAVFFNYHLLYSTKILNRKRWAYSFLVSFLILGVSFLLDLKSKFSYSSKLPLAYSVKPSWSILKSAKSIDNFIDSIEYEK